MAILEMNVSPEPTWAKKFQEYLETEHNFSKLDAMCAIGTLHHYMRKYKELVDEEELDKLTYTFANNNELLESLHISDNADVDDLAIAYKAGYCKALKE